MQQNRFSGYRPVNINSCIKLVTEPALYTSHFTNNGPFRNCQSLSFITVHGQFESNRLGFNCQVTV